MPFYKKIIANRAKTVDGPGGLQARAELLFCKKTGAHWYAFLGQLTSVAALRESETKTFCARAHLSLPRAWLPVQLKHQRLSTANGGRAGLNSKDAVTTSSKKRTGRLGSTHAHAQAETREAPCNSRSMTLSCKQFRHRQPLCTPINHGEFIQKQSFHGSSNIAQHGCFPL